MFDGAIKSFGFDHNIDEPCIYRRHNRNAIALLVLYVNDILIIRNDVGMLSSIKIWLSSQFRMKDLGYTSYVLGIKLMQNLNNRRLALSQASYIEKILVRFNMQNSKKVSLSSRHGVYLSWDQCPKTPEEIESMKRVPYAWAVGLMYAMLCTKPDI